MPRTSGKRRRPSGSPPAEFRFKRGQSGNPKGRPKGSGKANGQPHFFEQRFKLTVNGKKQSITRAEHLLLHARKVAIGQRNIEIADRLIAYKEAIDRAREKSSSTKVIYPLESWNPGERVKCLDDALRHLDIVRVMYRFTRGARMRLSPWIVSLSLKRLGDEGRVLTRKEQELVFHATRCPQHVAWPDWWEPDLCGRKRRAE